MGFGGCQLPRPSGDVRIMGTGRVQHASNSRRASSTSTVEFMSASMFALIEPGYPGRLCVCSCLCLCACARGDRSRSYRAHGSLL
eukprot:13538515-Alexandrium_andersonii.AAC.1